jgi:hypothetical protein
LFSSGKGDLAMERKRQLANVAFGGDWSEAIVPREQIQSAMQVLRLAVRYCQDVDPRTAEVNEALAHIRRKTRGDLLADAFLKAAGIENRDVRLAELQRVLLIIASAVGGADQAKS